MRTILDLNSDELKEYFFKNSSYINFDIPIYFDFSDLFSKLINEIWNKKISDLRSWTNKARDLEWVNYIFLNNKSWKYEWRPFQIIHPFLYIELVYLLSENNNWNLLKDRFEEFKNNWFIECISLPVISDTNNSNKAEQVLNWWEKIEQESIILSLEYDYIFHTDITDCYPSIYTHSISWALHWKNVMKKKENRNNPSFLWNNIDKILQDMSFWQTNWIPQWSNIMDFLAEIVLGYADILLKDEFTKQWLNSNSFKILRYRDDYRIFTNDMSLWEKILKILTEVLTDLWLKLSKWKTKYSNDIVKYSFKEDKYFWLTNSKYNKLIDKQLLIIKDFADKHSNSWTLLKILQEFNSKLSEKKLNNSYVNYKVFIWILTSIMVNNPRTFPIITAIISKIIKVNDWWREIVLKILKKFEKIPNTWHLEVWLQRITLKLDEDFNNYNSLLCKKVIDNNIELWNSKWIWNRKINKILKETKIISDEKISELDLVVSNNEVALFATNEYLFN